MSNEEQHKFAENCLDWTNFNDTALFVVLQECTVILRLNVRAKIQFRSDLSAFAVVGNILLFEKSCRNGCYLQFAEQYS
jgi:hypothetical protein